MRLIIAVLAVLLTAAVGLAQNSKLGKAPPKEAPTQNEMNIKKAEEKDYKSAIGRLPDQKFDPWRNMR